MKITIIGTGYVGLVSGACLADMGNEVLCLDKNPEIIKKLKKGIIPFYEQGLKELVEYNIEEKRLNFTNNAQRAIQFGEVISIAVGTPPQENGEADLSAIFRAAQDIAQYLNGYKLIVTKSTVPVGTNEKIKKIIKKYQKKPVAFDIASNPEFLSEGNAVKNFYNPDRIIIGLEKNKPRAQKIMLRIYRAITRSEKPLLITNIRTAEAIKYASNAFLATKISYINEIANFCEKVNANVDDVARGMGLDSRIGEKFLQAGVGYGGSCFPKDVRALIKMGEHFKSKFNIAFAADEVNIKQRQKMIEKFQKIMPKFRSKTATIWGLSFKPNTDDVRESPSVDITQFLLKTYPTITIKAYDPQAGLNFKTKFKNKNVYIARDPYQALKNTSILIILTDWDEFKLPDFTKMKKLMKEPNIIDGRNLYNPEEMKEAGFQYLSFGR